MALVQSQEDDADRMVSNEAQNDNNIIIGIIGDKSSEKLSICAKLGLPKHVKFQYFDWKNKWIGSRIGENNAIIIDIECAQKYHSYAINAVADCDVIIYVIPWTGYDDEESERLMRRYLEIAHIFRVKHFIVAITKIDYSSNPFITEKIFERATNRVKDIMKKTNIEKYDILPVVVDYNEDIEFITNCPNIKWYDGPTLKEILSATKPSREYKENPFLLTVTHFYKNSGVIIGKVRRGMVRVGERIKVFPSGIKGQIQSIQRNSEGVDSAVCGDYIGIKLKMKNGIKMDIKRGDIIQIDENPDRSEAVGDTVFRFNATIYVQRFQSSSGSIKSIPRILIESTANNNVGEDDNESEYIGVVQTYNSYGSKRNGEIRAGDTVEVAQNDTTFKVLYLKRMFPVTNDDPESVARRGDKIRFRLISEAQFQSNPEAGESFAKSQENHGKTGKSALFLALLARVPHTYQYSAYIFVRSKVSDDDQLLFENVGVVTYGDIKVGDTVLPFSSDAWNDRAKIKWIKKVTSNGNEEEVEEATCGDRIRFQVMLSYYRSEYPPMLKPGDQLKAPDKDDASFWRLYPKSFETDRTIKFTVFIGNGTAKCHIRSIKWSKNADGKRIENPEYLEQGDTAEVVMELHTPIHVTTYNEYPEFGAFVMVSDHTKKITESFIIGKVTEIDKMIPLQSIYKVTDRETIRTRKSMAQSNGDYALSCGKRPFGGLQSRHFVLYFCNRISKMLKKVIPKEVVEIIETYSRQNRQVLRGYDWKNWRFIPELSERNICKMVKVRYRSYRFVFSRWHWRRYRNIKRFCLEDNGSLWRSEKDNTMEIIPFFSENKIVIRDIAVGKGYKVKGGTVDWCYGYHCLAVDDNHNVYQFGLCGETQNVDNIKILNFPLPENERVQRCVALKCGLRHFYVCLRVKGRDEGGSDYYLDRHFMFGYNKGNQCLTFDGRAAVWTPFCINETFKTHYGGKIDSVFVDIENDTTHIVVKHCYRRAS